MKKIIFAFLALQFALVANAAELKKLRSSDALAKMASDISTEWTDGNISSYGMTKAEAFAVIPDDASWKTVAMDLLIENYYEDTKAKPGTVRVTPYSSTSFNKTIDALMASNDYSPSNSAAKSSFKKDLSKMLSKLGIDEKDGIVVTATATAQPSDWKQNIVSTLFVNTKTEKAILIFAAQGSM